MKWTRLFVLMTLTLIAMHASAGTYYVGACHTGSFPTISAAVSSSTVAAGSTIKVCPGTYPEQVIISKSLTLQGLSANGLGAANIQGSASDLTVTNLDSELLRPRIWVTGGTVNLSNINITQAYSPSDCSSYIAGIYYASGSSGIINHVNVSIVPSGQPANCTTSVGAWLENGNTLKATVTVENSTFEVGNQGIFAMSKQAAQAPPVLSATISGNQIFIYGVNSTGISMQNDAGTVAKNMIAGGSVGVVMGSTGLAVTGNTINTAQGIQVGPQATVTGNRIRSATGIVFDCKTGTVTGNTITGDGSSSSTGYVLPPKGFSGVNSFHNVAKTSSGTC